MRKGQAIRIRAFLVLATAAVLLCAQEGGRGLMTVKSVGSITGIGGNAGKRYALCIGINVFQDPLFKALPGPRNDAVELADALRKFGQFDAAETMIDDINPAYDPGGRYPSLVNIRARMAAMTRVITPDDLVLFSFAGHGIATDAGDSHLVLSETRAEDRWNTSLPVREVLDWINGLNVRKSLILLDACREKAGGRGLAETSLRAQKYEQSQVSAIFYGTRTGWLSYDDPDSGHGIFTRFLLEGIKGKADYQAGNGDGIITFRELSGFVEQQVTSYAHELGYDQSPSVNYNREAFGDLAVSTYSAQIDVATRIEVGREGSAAVKGTGSAAVYSNVEGSVELDGSAQGRIEMGQTLPLGDLPAGRHRIVIQHPYGVFEKEFAVKDGGLTHVANLVINRPERDNRQIGDVPFVFVKGSGDVPDFWMGMTEIRFGQFARFAKQSGYKARGSWEQYYKPAYDYYPVVHVTWDDCMAYAQWLSKTFRVKASLPSLAQWQYAAGARYGRTYPWGNEWDPGYCQCADSAAPDALPLDGRNGTLQEMSFLNDITLDGVKMLAGNVSEWCNDRKKSSSGADLAASAGGNWKISRPKYFAAGYSQFRAVTAEEADQGFRVVMEAD